MITMLFRCLASTSFAGIAPLLLIFCFMRPAIAQDLAGMWQGKINNSQYVLKVSRSPGGGYRGAWYILGPERPGSPASGDTASAIIVNGRDVKFTLDQTLDNFTGTISPDGNAIAGNWLCCWGPQKPQPLTLMRATAKTAWVVDPSPHRIRFVSVEKGVSLEVLDWGGSGPPMVFLAGLGNTAHVFDDFAPKFTAHHHVYGITRRGFGASSVPPAAIENYDADRLGDDILAVMAALKIERPVLAGHSISGEELSSIGTRHPEKLSGLIYLDAITSSRAYYAEGTDTYEVDLAMLRRAIDRFPPSGDRVSDARSAIEELLVLMPKVEQRLKSLHDELPNLADDPGSPWSPQQQAVHAIGKGERKYAAVKLPILVITPSPPACGSNCDSPAAKKYQMLVESFVNAFQTGNPDAHIVRLPHAAHQVWRSNAPDVEREANAFMDSLRKQ
jgi:pimeloyl-ACP methyl ester carboxylesterase